jgi:hypothetical protein
VRIKWQHHGANLKGDCQNGLRRLACAHERSAGANLVPIIPVVTIMSGFLPSRSGPFYIGNPTYSKGSWHLFSGTAQAAREDEFLKKHQAGSLFS